MTPISFTVRDNKLRLRWTDMASELPGNLLRDKCRCAGCRYLELTADAVSHGGVELLAVTPMGYGLQLHFSDGHNRGIYPWSYLKNLNAR